MGCGQGKQSDDKSAGPGQNKAQDKKAATDDNKDFSQKLQFISKVPMFKRLPKDQHPLVATHMIGVNFKSNEKVITQGDAGDEFFVIREGEAKVLANDKQVATLKSGDYFGENALLRDEPRTATITAVGELKTYKLTREKFQELGLNEKLQFANRKAVGGGANVQNAKTKPPTPKTDADKKLIKSALKSNPNLNTMVKLDDRRVEMMADVAWKEEIKAGTEVIQEGDLQADFFYIVASGKFEISVSQTEEDKDQGASMEAAVNEADENENTEPTGSKVVKQVPTGGSFGELALLYLVPRAATVKATEDSVVWVIDRSNFKSILMKVSDEKIEKYKNLLGGCKQFDALIDEEKKELAKALVEMHFTKNEVILQQGEPGSTFYILYEGTVQVIKDNKEEAKLSASEDRGEAKYFGEKAILEKEVRGATVQVCSSTAKALVVDRDSFDALLGPLQDIIKKKEDKNRKSAVGNRLSQLGTANPSDANRDKILRKDLSRIGLLGCGGFGTVELYEHKQSKDTYAMKGLSKGYIVKTGMQESVMNEKNILMMTNSKFVIKLFETYNGTQSLYFLLEPALGGELYATYNRKGLHGSEKHAKYYVAGVIFAFEHLHERRIIYRDLKPENLLLTQEGHIKLTDMGLAKFVIGKTYTTCGTPDYFAPELIASTGHTNAVDWWTVGVLIFELMSGHPPFESAYPMQIYSKVMKGINKVPFPIKCQGTVGELIKLLLKNEPSERLPVRPGGTKNLKEHKWFTENNKEGAEAWWKKMYELKLEPPYKPVVQSKKDLANFSARKEDMPRQIEYHDNGTGWDKDFASVP